MWKKIIQKYKSQLSNVIGSKKIWTPSSEVDESIQGEKAVVFQNGKPIMGTILKVFPAVCKQPPYPIKIFVSLLTSDNREITFQATKKLLERQFYLVSAEFYRELEKDGDLEIVYQEAKFSRSKNEKKTEVTAHTLAAVRPGDLVETIILSGKHKGIWIRAEVQHIEEKTMNLRQLRPEKWKVVRFAVNVPKKFIRCILPENKENYTVPIWFVADNKVHYIKCSKEITVYDLKQPLSKLRGVEPNQLILICGGVALSEGIPVPDDKIFGIICEKGGLTPNQQRLLANKGTRIETEEKAYRL